MRARFLKYRDKGFGVRASLISIQSSNSMTVSGGPWWNCMVCSVRWQNQMLEAQTIKAWGEHNLSSSKGWVGESIKELNSGTSEPIMIEKKHRKKSKRKKSESLSDRFLLGVSDFLMMITICGLMIISNDASGLWSEVIAKITEEWGSLVGGDSLPWTQPQHVKSLQLVVYHCRDCHNSRVLESITRKSERVGELIMADWWLIMAEWWLIMAEWWLIMAEWWQTVKLLLRRREVNEPCSNLPFGHSF